ncbi:methylated-DNA--[protein]-cysteine S-methyltransferase [Christensenellaceae bacterium OttesenSCG-928-L17]|nr:methylated-DNA--[protein]-cysteine S-methyltransferase [Christensenellaceae bacterium OttesenSCG-928-L17]
MKFVYFYDSPVGKLGIAQSLDAITDVFFGDHYNADTYIEQETTLIATAASQLDEYFHGTRTSFELPLAPQGPAFSVAVWMALCDIPYGETRSYQDIARAVGNPSACRAVGNASRKNPIAILLPCHRVVGANGKLSGYAGGLERKAFLLAFEKAPQS